MDIYGGTPYMYIQSSCVRFATVKLCVTYTFRIVTSFREITILLVNCTNILPLWGIPLRLPCGSAGKESAHNAGDLGSIPGLGRSPGEGKGHPLQYSGLENSMDYTDMGRKESDTTERLSLISTKCFSL